MSCFASFKEICQPDAELAPLTTFKLGGPARWLLTPRDEAELAAVLNHCYTQKTPWRLLGQGANVLVRDAGVDSAVIKLTGPVWEMVRWEDPLVHVAAGADFTKLVKQSFEHNLAGLENLAGIPGSVGGIIRMNAGGKHGYIADWTHSIRLMDPIGAIITRQRHEIPFAYRHTDLAGGIVLSATFQLQPGQRSELNQRYQAIWGEKKATQPSLGMRTAGCIFKNPPGDSAGRLLDELGLKGTRIGGAEISRHHANFIVADEGATAQNVLDLITRAKEQVRESAGIELELEVEIW
ncbi:MAG: UDP-N-acetylmuramate dehydrogenase [Planctomycetota bacterium]